MRQICKTTICACASWLVLHTSAASAQVVATCSESEGYSNFHNTALVPSARSGFQTDKITGGLTTIQRLESGEYDVLFVDARKQVLSYRNDGGRVILLRRGGKDATFLAVAPGARTIELYTVYIDAAGVKRLDMLQSKGGDDMPIHKSTVMTGSCSYIDLGAAK